MAAITAPMRRAHLARSFEIPTAGLNAAGYSER
jgi:hypothetical protein